MQCRNGEAGCYHDRAVHLDGGGRCVVRGCRCARFVQGAAAA